MVRWTSFVGVFGAPAGRKNFPAVAKNAQNAPAGSGFDPAERLGSSGEKLELDCLAIPLKNR